MHATRRPTSNSAADDRNEQHRHAGAGDGPTNQPYSSAIKTLRPAHDDQVGTLGVGDINDVAAGHAAAHLEPGAGRGDMTGGELSCQERSA